jgi:NitT/TauT family transport system permease protein
MGTIRYFRRLTLGIQCCGPSAAGLVPASAIFWPSVEMSVVFVTFLGAFFVLILNIVGGAGVSARVTSGRPSPGGQSPGCLLAHRARHLTQHPRGYDGGIGVCWNTVVAAEMIASRSGLGFLTWRSYVTFSYPMIVVGMISIGIAGYISSGIIRILGVRLMPWPNQLG